jgi:N-acetyl-1-D-myo-inositol-2-amino-2-deoxy-alpha-D-glucopyranoside deacetylase
LLEESLTLLSVLAHPDDESFGMGGTLALYARRGAKVHLVCATRGEAGGVDDQYLEGFSSIAERRESELRCAAGILGLSSVHFLDYRDSGMSGSPDNTHPDALAAAPLEQVAGRIAGLIRKLQPQVVLTFDPIGGYKHPDHIAVHNAAVRAFSLAADPNFITDLPPFQPQKLYFHLMPKHWLKIAVTVLPILGKDPRRFGKNQDIDLLDIVQSGDFPVHARINYQAVLKEKDAAAACHISQLDGASLRQGPLRWLQWLFARQDVYMRAFPPPVKGKIETDLFAGVKSL